MTRIHLPGKERKKHLQTLVEMLTLFSAAEVAVSSLLLPISFHYHCPSCSKEYGTVFVMLSPKLQEKVERDNINEKGLNPFFQYQRATINWDDMGWSDWPTLGYWSRWTLWYDLAGHVLWS